VSLRFEQQTGPTGNLPGLIAEFTWNGGSCTKTHSKQRSRRAKANGGAKQLNQRSGTRGVPGSGISTGVRYYGALAD